MPQKNECVTLEIIDITHEGSGIGKLDGMAVFVSAAAVGDLLEVRLVKVNKTYCFGRIEKIVRPSPDRIAEDCRVSRRCGGCVFRHVSYKAELRYKHQFVQGNLRRIGGFDLAAEQIIPSPAEQGYRNKAQYPVQSQNGTLCAGFFAARSHNVVDCRDCRLQPPLFRAVLDCILDFCGAQAIPPYDEATHTGCLRHIYLRQGAHSGELMVCLVCNAQSFPKAELLAQKLREAAPNLVSLLLNRNREKTNVILGAQTELLWGKATISDTMCGLRFSLSPHAFYQVNTPAAEQLYALAAEYAQLDDSQTLLDLYCGAGTIGLSMAHRVKQVIGVEIVPQAVENAKANAAENGISNARFLCADAGIAAAQLEKEGVRPDVIVLDPPRKGCDEATLSAVARMAPQKLIYISCNSATLARDCCVLADLGWTLVRYRPADLFPRTAHVETVALLTR